MGSLNPQEIQLRFLAKALVDVSSAPHTMTRTYAVRPERATNIALSALVDVIGERNSARHIACGVSDRRAPAPAR
jgi:hypothetical protein